MGKLSILFTFIILLFCSCEYENEEDLFPFDPNTCELDLVSYKIHIEPIINKSCAISGCHIQGGLGTGTLTSYNDVKRDVNSGTFQREVFVNMTMPQNSSLPKCELDQLMKWVLDGAPNN